MRRKVGVVFVAWLVVCLTVVGVQAQSWNDSIRSGTGSRSSVTGTPNIFGGQDYSNGVSSRSNIFGGQTYQDRSGRTTTGTPNIFGGQDYSNGVSSRSNIFGGRTYQVPNNSSGGYKHATPPQSGAYRPASRW